jgi:hypothetical protein
VSGLVQIRGRRTLEHEEERRALLFYERFVRSSGVLYGMAGLAFVLSVVGALIDGVSRVDPIAALTLFAAGCILGILGAGMFRLDARAKTPAMIAALLGLLALGSFLVRGGVPRPVIAMSAGGAIFHGALLAVLVAPKGRRLLSPAYRETLHDTQSIKAGPSFYVWAIVGLTLAAAVIA